MDNPAIEYLLNQEQIALVEFSQKESPMAVDFLIAKSETKPCQYPHKGSSAPKEAANAKSQSSQNSRSEQSMESSANAKDDSNDNTIDQSTINEIETNLVGKSFELHIVEREMKIGDKLFKMPAFEFKDAKQSMKRLREAAKTSNIRVFFPGTLGTADMQPGRVNFQFDEKGVLIRAFLG